MSIGDKQKFLWIGRIFVGFCTLCSTAMIGFAIWAFDARVREVGDTRYVSKENYNRDYQDVNSRLRNNENEILNVIKTAKNKGATHD